MAKYNRKAAEAWMLNFVKGLDPSGRNYENLKQIYAGMTDQQFVEMATAMREKRAYTPFIYDHETDNLPCGRRPVGRDRHGGARRNGRPFLEAGWPRADRGLPPRRSDPREHRRGGPDHYRTAGAGHHR